MKTTLTSRRGHMRSVTRGVVGLLGAAWLMLLADTSVAEPVKVCEANCPPNFAICDGQTGVALGLCNGAVAHECHDTNANTDACLRLKERFQILTGQQDVPWIYAYYPVQSYTAGGGSVDLETGIQCLDPTGVNPPMCVGDLEVGFDGTEPPAYLNPFRLVAMPCPPPEQSSMVFEEYAFLDGAAFATVSPPAIDSATFTSAATDYGYMPVFDAGDTAILHTCAGNYFKVGLLTCNLVDSPWTQCNDTGLPDWSVRFYYQLLRRAP